MFKVEKNEHRSLSKSALMFYFFPTEQQPIFVLKIFVAFFMWNNSQKNWGIRDWLVLLIRKEKSSNLQLPTLGYDFFYYKHQGKLFHIMKKSRRKWMMTNTHSCLDFAAHFEVLYVPSVILASNTRRCISSLSPKL